LIRYNYLIQSCKVLHRLVGNVLQKYSEIRFLLLDQVETSSDKPEQDLEKPLRLVFLFSSDVNRLEVSKD
jgi:hypothetical protein